MTRTKEMNRQLHELFKAYLSSHSSVARSIEFDLKAIVKVFDENSEE